MFPKFFQGICEHISLKDTELEYLYTLPFPFSICQLQGFVKYLQVLYGVLVLVLILRVHDFCGDLERLELCLLGSL